MECHTKVLIKTWLPQLCDSSVEEPLGEGVVWGDSSREGTVPPLSSFCPHTQTRIPGLPPKCSTQERILSRTPGFSHQRCFFTINTC